MVEEGLSQANRTLGNRISAALLEVEDANCRTWVDWLLASGSPLYHTIDLRDIETSAHALYEGLCHFIQSGDVAEMRALFKSVALRRYAAGFPLADMEQALGVVRQSILPTVLDVFADEPALIAEAVADVMTAEEMAAILFAEAYQELSAARIEAEHERALRAEHEKVLFCRDMARVVTGNKLILCDAGDIPAQQGVALLNVATAPDVRTARYAAKATATACGWEPDRIYELQLCVGEAGTNAIRHAGSAVFQVWADDSVVTFRIADSGPGIDLCHIPASLQAGFSTGSSLGMGFTLMLDLADLMYLATDSTGTVVQITMRSEKAMSTPPGSV